MQKIKVFLTSDSWKRDIKYFLGEERNYVFYTCEDSEVVDMLGVFYGLPGVDSCEVIPLEQEAAISGKS